MTVIRAVSAGPVPAVRWAAEPSLEVTALGQPKPKGSMKHVGHGRMTEQVEESPAWRTTVKDATVAAIAVARLTSSSTEFPLTGSLRFDATVTVSKPKSAPKRRETYPQTRSSGDADKLLRNLFDAVKDAGAVRDDSQFVEATIRKHYPGQHPDTLATPGVVIRIYIMEGPHVQVPCLSGQV